MIISYEEALRRPEFFLKETSFFMGKSRLHRALEILDSHVEEYAVCGGMAMGFHGVPRMTEDIDVVVTRATFDTFVERFRGRGYVEVTPHSYRQVSTGVRIDFLIVPSVRAEYRAGFPVVPREALIRMKKSAGRLQDLADVERLEGVGDDGNDRGL